MKRAISIFLAIVVMLAMAGCGNSEALTEKDAQIAQLQALLDLGNTSVVALHATIDNKGIVQITEATELEAQAILGEGEVVDHWEINGETVAEQTQQSLTFQAEPGDVVAAVVRPEKKLTTINAELRFLNADKKAAGEAMTEFVFEEEYVNPVTNETCEGGKISAEIKAVVPAGKVVDYWKINGVPYYYNSGVSSFIVEDLDEATTYEVVLKDRPITYYKVTCIGCSFNGKKSGSVPAGTTITVKAAGDYTSRFYVNGSFYAEYVKSITLKITGDTVIESYAIIN